LPENIYKSILHPGGIKTGKLLVNNKPETSQSKKRHLDIPGTQEQDLKKVKSNEIKHKFQFV
jgi:hypothetical protein